MPLNEREQQILEEIERQFRVEDPELSRRASSLPQLADRRFRLPIAGAALGLLVLLATFSFNTALALAGFGLMVVSVSALIRMRRGSKEISRPALREFLLSARNSRWPFRR